EVLRVGVVRAPAAADEHVVHPDEVRTTTILFTTTVAARGDLPPGEGGLPRALEELAARLLGSAVHGEAEEDGRALGVVAAALLVAIGPGQEARPGHVGGQRGVSGPPCRVCELRVVAGQALDEHVNGREARPAERLGTEGLAVEGQVEGA